MREVIFLVLHRTLQKYLEKIAPSYLESDWDNSGPQVELDQEELEEVLIGLDPTIEFIEKGVEAGTDLLITHHPLVFSELNKLDLNSPTGQKIDTLTRNRVGLTAIHTPFDRSARGLSQGLAKTLGLGNLSPLKRSKSPDLLKLTVFVPKADEERVKDALLESGAGTLGSYRNSYYRSEAEGNFTPTEDANPELGQPGRTKKTQESRLEFLLSPKYRDEVLSTLKRVHPYEAPGFSIEETKRKDQKVGLGRLGEWDQSMDLDEITSLVANRLETSKDDMIVTGELTGSISRVATSPGAGGEAVNSALGSGVELLITGELDYHERLEASERGLTVIEAGHFNTEKVFIPRLKELLREEFSPEALEIDLYGEGIL